ncbi:TetR/AcrR family transcriptional regulator [Salipiger abyssi]|uniref:Transcriptional regulator n=1 Tax=Salipiger abyssi TaxID=1250539 RepID=A0A1P8UV36_9RHOB|nr:TetR/AcrR family transcriptional regulator [Salipiger abyssi]APZ53253.1 transcriptional regulator [Salipiger abyssi]
MARPRKTQQIDIRTRAIAETIRLLDEKAATAITLSEVATAVGCRAPALYTHFANKDALLRAVHDAGFRMMLEEKLALAAHHDGDAFARLREGGHAYLRFAFERSGLYRLMFSPPPLVVTDESPFATDAGAACLAALRAAVRGCQAEGYLPAEDDAQTAFTLWSAVHGAASLVLQDRAPVADQAGARAAAMATVDMLMGFISATRRPLS